MASLLLAPGCSETRDSLRDAIQTVDQRISAGILGFERRTRLRGGGAQVSDGVFMAAAAERVSQAALLPPEVQGENAVNLVSRDPLRLEEIADRLSDITGIPHITALGPAGLPSSTSAEVRDQAANEAETTVPQEEGEEGSGRSGGNDAMRITRSGGEGGSTAGRMMIRPNLNGPLSKVLNDIAAAFEVDWSYEDGRIVLRDYVTRQYQIAPLATSMQMSNDISAVTSSNSIDLGAEIETALEGLVGEGGSISIGLGTGMVTATARVSDHARIHDYIARVNAVLSQQIAFDVNVMTVSLTRGDSVGVNLTAALQNANSNLEWESMGAGEEGGGLNVGLVLGELDLDIVIRSLSRSGRVSLENRTGGTTTNNRMVPIEIVDELAYVKERSIVRNDSGEITDITTTVDTVKTGFSLKILPRVLNSREIMVEYAVELSDLTGIEVFGEGEGAIQLPEVSTTAFQQQVILENGQTLILAGFERQRMNSDQEGMGSPEMFGLGGKDEVSLERVAQVIFITPRILSRRAVVR
jgi:type II secretory pathway component GspD/PulD (secretin)